MNRIIVIGGGIGGAATALALGRAGFEAAEVIISKRALAGFFWIPVATAVGAGVTWRIVVIEQKRDDTMSALKNKFSNRSKPANGSNQRRQISSTLEQVASTVRCI